MKILRERQTAKKEYIGICSSCGIIVKFDEAEASTIHTYSPDMKTTFCRCDECGIDMAMRLRDSESPEAKLILESL